MGSKSRPHPRARRATSVHRAEPLEPRLLLATISGQVWNDADGDGRRDLTDRGLAGWTVYVDLDDDNAHDGSEPSDVTDGSGNYSITSLAIRTGTYAVREVAQAGWRPTDPATGERAVTFLRLGDTASDVDFGNTQRALVTGTVFDDANEDGAPDRGEDGLSGWTVFSDANANGLLDTGEVSDLTDLTGDYALILPAGSHTIRQVRPPDWWQTGPAGGAHALTLSNGQVASARHFGNVVATYDLIGAGFAITSAFAPAPADGRLDVLYQLRNTGTADSPGFRVAFYLSDDETITTGDTFLRSVANGSVPRRSTETRTTVVNLPDPDPFRTDNQYWVGMIVDELNDVAETNEANNSNQGLLSDRHFVSSEADLPMPADNATVSARPVTLGTDVTSSLGDEWIGGYDVDVYRFTSPAGRLLFAGVVGSPGVSVRLYDGSWALLEGPAPQSEVLLPNGGTYYAVVSSDANDTSNPRRLTGRSLGTAAPYTLRVQDRTPELRPAGLSFTGRPPDPVTVSLTIAEDGFFRSSSQFDVALYLSDDEHISAADLPLETVRVTGGSFVPSASAYERMVNVTLPPTDPFRTDNEYWLGMIVDAAGEVAERVESNNANLARGLDRVAFGSEDNLPVPADGATAVGYGLPFFDISFPPPFQRIGNEWIGSHDRDAFLFTAGAGERAAFDVDHFGGTLDTYLQLFDSDWRLLAENDNGIAPGEPSNLDSFLQFRFDEAGDYWLVVSAAGNHASDPRRLTGRTAASTGSYQVTRAFVPAAPVTGVAFEDNNANGVSDAGEPVIAGRRLRLSGVNFQETRNATTDGQGVFRFENVRPGAYRLEQEVPDGWLQTTPASHAGHAFAVASGQVTQPFPFGSVRGGAVSGNAFHDVNDNGTRDVGEAALGGALAYVDMNNNGVRDLTTLTLTHLDAFRPRTVEVVGQRMLRVADLDVELHAPVEPGPSGGNNRSASVRRVTDFFARTLFAFQYAGPGPSRVDAIFDDEAPAPYTQPGSPFGRYRPLQSLAIYDGVMADGLWSVTHDTVNVPAESWSLHFTLTEPSAVADVAGNFTIGGLLPGQYHVRLELPADWVGTGPASGGRAVDLPAGTHAGSVDLGARPIRLQVTGRHVFYNNSAFDGRDPAANAADDAAIASDKRPLVDGGGAAGAANVTGYSRGINGVMVDVSELAAALTLADFSFQVVSPLDPAAWVDAPAPTGFAVRGIDAADPARRRLTFTWPDNVLRNTWLKVSVLANPNTRRPFPDVFSFGNLVGETGGVVGANRVSAADFVATRAAAYRGRAGLDNRFDHDRDGFVTVKDVAIVRSNLNRSLPAPLVAAPAGAARSAAPLPADHRATGLLDDSAGDIPV